MAFTSSSSMSGQLISLIQKSFFVLRVSLVIQATQTCCLQPPDSSKHWDFTSQSYLIWFDFFVLLFFKEISQNYSFTLLSSEREGFKIFVCFCFVFIQDKICVALTILELYL